MEPFLLVLVLAALACPLTMFGPTLWARLRGKQGGAAMSCMGMMSEQEPRAGIEELRAQRAELDGQIALLASAQEASRRRTVTQDS